MVRLLVLLGVSLFTTMLIGGRDNGQQRLGLQAAYEAPKRVIVAQIAPKAAAPVQKAAESPAVTLATFTPAAPAPQPAAVPAALSPTPVVATPEPAVLPVLFVDSRAVNVREGPSTAYGVVGRLVRAEAVSVVEPAVNGWVHIRMEGDGVEGYVAASLLSATDPEGN